jgi:protease IV
MKKSRTGIAVAIIALLVVCFVVLVVVASLLMESDEESSGIAGLFSSGNKIGVVTLEGTITSSDEVLKQLRKFYKKRTVRAIIIRINSPGGTVAPAQEIYREIGKIKKKKPVVASIETLGTSAAYYIASSCDNIVCSAGSITGSIGVIMMLTDIHQVIEKIGVGVSIIKAGKYKDIGTGVRPIREDEREILESFAKEIHEQFIKDVAAGRKGKIELESLRTIADGRFFTGERAKEMGLVDTMGNLFDAVRIAAKLGGIKTDPKLMYPEKRWENYLDLVMESASRSVYSLMERAKIMQTAPVAQ